MGTFCKIQDMKSIAPTKQTYVELNGNLSPKRMKPSYSKSEPVPRKDEHPATVQDTYVLQLIAMYDAGDKTFRSQIVCHPQISIQFMTPIMPDVKPYSRV